LPVDLVKIVKKEVKRGKFASTSEYFRYLLRAQKEAGNIERAREDFRKGRNWKVLKSIKDLM